MARVTCTYSNNVTPITLMLIASTLVASDARSGSVTIEVPEHNLHVQRVLESSINRKPGQTLESLYELFSNVEDSGPLLVHLLNYHLGAGPGAMRQEYISRKGIDVLPALAELARRPVECSPEYSQICADRVSRDANILELITAIESGIFLCVQSCE